MLQNWVLIILMLILLPQLVATQTITETDPMKYDTMFSLSLISNASTFMESGPINRYSDAYEKATTFFRNQYGIDISSNGTRLPTGCQLITGITSEYVVDNAKVRGYPIIAGGQDVGVHDDTLSVLFNRPTTVNGVYGGQNGSWVDSNSVLFFGFYTFFWRNNGSDLFPRITYSSMMPIRMSSNSSLINFQLSSTLFGQGYARGTKQISYNSHTGKSYTAILSSHTYPTSMTDFLPKCYVITAEKDIFNEDYVIKWNNVLLSVIRDLKVVPPIAARQMAILHIAIDDALVSCRELRFTERNCSVPTLISIISHAASRVLSSLFPNYLDCFNSALKSALACRECKNISRTSLINIGKSGSLAADKILNNRSNDGCMDFVDYQFSNYPMSYQSHPPNFVRIPLLPQWSFVKPFVIDNTSIYDQGPPPQIGTPTFEKDYNETFNYGSDNSAVRTLDQRRIALFWAGGSGTSTSVGHWSLILQSIIRSMNIVDTFRISFMFKVLSISIADSVVVCWHHKYKYNSLRPVTAISNRNRETKWSPLLSTPPFPEYSSGHSTLSGTASTILSLLLGSDNIPFEISSEGFPNHLRKFNKISDAAKEAGKSRIYGGIHFEYANKAGLKSGSSIAQDVYAKLDKSSNNQP